MASSSGSVNISLQCSGGSQSSGSFNPGTVDHLSSLESLMNSVGSRESDSDTTAPPTSGNLATVKVEPQDSSEESTEGMSDSHMVSSQLQQDGVANQDCDMAQSEIEQFDTTSQDHFPQA